jgi:hypothetical protein
MTTIEGILDESWIDIMFWKIDNVAHPVHTIVTFTNYIFTYREMHVVDVNYVYIIVKKSILETLL